VSLKARDIQLRRQGVPNAQLTEHELQRYARYDGKGQDLLRDATTSFSLSARGLHRVLKIARTIADLQQSAGLTADHIAEAIQYRGARS